MTEYNENAAILDQELNWFNSVLERRIQDYFNPDNPEKKEEVSLPDLNGSDTWYARFVKRYGFSLAERIVLMLALAPEVRPQILDIFFTRNKLFDRGYTEFGGIQGQRHSGFIPTVQTALFILAGDDLAPHMRCSSFFEHDHLFRKCGILDLDASDNNEPFTSTALHLSRDTFSLFTKGRNSEPEYSTDFPAKKLETLMEWDDLVLSPQTHEQLKELRAWLDHGEELLTNWKIEKHIKPGYRGLFYGPPGTGKTLTASLLGKISGRSVYRIDLSQLVSKYIGETEKNLEKIFQQAAQKDWILFFDEADSLFGKRTQITDAHDRYANQGTAYLLQRIEDCPNVVILASNLKTNIDEAFARRFQSMTYFPMPQKRERLQLWKQGFSPISTLEERIDLDELADSRELSGGSIMNVVRYCSLMAIQQKSTEITWRDLEVGVQREFSKEGKSV